MTKPTLASLKRKLKAKVVRRIVYTATSADGLNVANGETEFEALTRLDELIERRRNEH